MKFTWIVCYAVGLVIAISAVGFVFDRVTYTPGMIEYRDDIQKWREVRWSRKDRIMRSALFGCTVVSFPFMFWCESKWKGRKTLPS